MYNSERGVADISFEIDTEILENAVKSRNIHFILGLFEPPYTIPVSSTTLKIAAEFKSRDLMEQLFKKGSHINLSRIEILSLVESAERSESVEWFWEAKLSSQDYAVK